MSTTRWLSEITERTDDRILSDAADLARGTDGWPCDTENNILGHFVLRTKIYAINCCFPQL